MSLKTGYTGLLMFLVQQIQTLLFLIRFQSLFWGELYNSSMLFSEIRLPLLGWTFSSCLILDKLFVLSLKTL